MREDNKTNYNNPDNEVKTEVEVKPKISNPEDVAKSNDAAPAFRITGCTHLNVRSKPMKQNNVIVVIDKYATIEVLRKLNEEWSKVKVDDSEKEYTGYIVNQFIKEV